LSKKYEFLPKNYKKCALFTNFYKKITKNYKKYQFFCRIRAENLPLYDKPNPLIITPPEAKTIT